MPTITLGNFRGMAPRASPRLIGDNVATHAENARLDSGMLRGMRAPEHVHTVTNTSYPRRIFRVQEGDRSTWLASREAEAELVQSPLVNETLDRWYLFEPDNAPRVIRYDEIEQGVQPYRLRVAPPLEAPSLRYEVGTGNDDLKESRVYVISYVTEWGEETAASPAATVVTPTDGHVRISNLYSRIYQPLEGRDWEHVRIYRTVFGENSAELYFVADVPWGDEYYTDSADPSEIVFNNSSPGPNDMPPDGLQGPRVHPSGALVAFKGRDVYFSRPYMPHAWPETYKTSVEDKIVGLEVVGTSVLVFTKGKPAVLYGQQPQAMGLKSFPMALPCSNYRAIVAMPEGIYYPSRDGLVLFKPNGPQLLTTGTISQDEWYREYYSEELVATRHENTYVAVKPEGDGFIISQDSSGFSVSKLEGLGGLVDLYKDKWLGVNYIMNNGEVYQWDPPTGDEITYRWRSKEFFSPEPRNFNAVQAEFVPKPSVYEEGAFGETLDKTGLDLRHQIVFRAWADGQLVSELPLTNGEVHRLQSGYKGSVWQFEIQGQCPLHSVSISDTVKGLGRG